MVKLDILKFKSRFKLLDNGCWEWISLADSRYGSFCVNGISEPSHRVSYNWFVAPLEPGKEIHHTCSNGKCVNPEHLIQLTRHEHMKIHRPIAIRKKLERAGGISGFNRVCLSCKELRPNSEFHKDSSSRSGFRSRCKTCSNKTKRRKLF